MNSYYWKDGWMVRNTDGAVMAKIVESENTALLCYDSVYGRQCRRFGDVAAAKEFALKAVERSFNIYQE